jgi:hypothetical protein
MNQFSKKCEIFAGLDQLSLSGTAFVIANVRTSRFARHSSVRQKADGAIN